jgi:predicted metal-dependent phosphoesterase TrpH
MKKDAVFDSSFLLHPSSFLLFMPARQPFTALCQLAARGRHVGRADLHVHTTASDGTYRADQIIDLARRSGLSAIAITDHDTWASVPAARLAAGESGVEVVTGVEISAEYQGEELHLLGYFVDENDGPLAAALERVRRGRSERFREMIERLRGCGVSIGKDELEGEPPVALGRRHLAELIVRARRASTVREAFVRYLQDGGRVAVPKQRVPVAEALALVAGAGGVAAWAHPSYDCERGHVLELRGLGLGALEVDFPAIRGARGRELRAWAAALGLAVTGGSDCHGPGRNAPGSHGISATELEQLRQTAAR